MYLAWLYCVQMDEIDEEEFEPPVPPNLRDLNAPLKSFVDFMRIDTDFVAVAAENSASKDKQTEYQKELRSWINNLPENEKGEILFRMVKDHDPHLGTEILQRFQQAVSGEDNDATGNKPRTVEDLVTKVEAYSAARESRIAEQKAEERARKARQKAIAREKYLDDLADSRKQQP